MPSRAVRISTGVWTLPFPQRLQDFEPATTRQHQIQQHEIERLGVRSKETVLAGWRDHGLVALRLKRRRDDLSQLPLIFDHEDAHRCMLPRSPRTVVILTQMSERCQEASL